MKTRFIALALLLLPLVLVREGGREPIPTRAPIGAGQPDPAAFVAARDSRVFHRAECRFVPTIARRHRVEYATREEATAAGKRPCRVCAP